MLIGAGFMRAATAAGLGANGMLVALGVAVALAALALRVAARRPREVLSAAGEVPAAEAHR
jgi:hypothetical protein